MNDGPPKVTCSICREQVLKSQTYHIGEGKRACKSHENIIEKSKEKFEIDAKFKSIKAERDEQRLFSGKTVNSCMGELDIDDCWVCGKEGILSKTLQVVRDAVINLLEMDGTALNLSSEDFTVQMKGEELIKGKSGIRGDFKSVDIIYLNTLDAKKRELVPLVIRQKHKMAFEKVWGRLVVICQDCATQLKIEVSK